MMMVFVTLMGVGMGLSIPSFLVAVQTSVERRHLAPPLDTAIQPVDRGTLGVSVMGAAFERAACRELERLRFDPGLVARLLDPLSGSGIVVDEGVRLAMANAIMCVHDCLRRRVLGLVAVFFTPRRELKDITSEGEPSLMVITD